MLDRYEAAVIEAARLREALEDIAAPRAGAMRWDEYERENAGLRDIARAVNSRAGGR